MMKWAGVILLTAAIWGLGVWWFICPCERMPGGALAGKMAMEPVTDWSRVNGVGLCQVEVNAGLPWSINLNCMAADGDLYVSCSRCEGKTWSGAALEDPAGFIRVEEDLYPVNLRRVTGAAELDRAWTARVAKLGLDPGTERPDHWWSFNLTSR